MADPLKLTPEVHRQLVDAAAADVSISDAARAAGVTRDTLRDWIRRGRVETSGARHQLAADWDAAKAAAADSLPAVADRAELLELVTTSARRGSVQAQRLLADLLDEEDQAEPPRQLESGPLAIVDRHAARSRRR